MVSLLDVVKLHRDLSDDGSIRANQKKHFRWITRLYVNALV